MRFPLSPRMCLYRCWHLCSHVFTRPCLRALGSPFPHGSVRIGSRRAVHPHVTPCLPCPRSRARLAIGTRSARLPEAAARLVRARAGWLPRAALPCPPVLGGISIGLYLMAWGRGGKYLSAVVLQITTLQRGNKSHPFVLALLKIFYKVPTFPVQLNGFHCRKLLGQRGTLGENIIYNDSQTHKNTLPSLSILPARNKHLVTHSQMYGRI